MIKGYLKLIVLKELMEDSLTGYELMERMKKFFGKKPSSGTIYPLLKDLHERKYISLKDDGNKKYYKATASGKRLAQKLIHERKEMMLKRAEFLESAKGMLNDSEHEEISKMASDLDRTSPHIDMFIFNYVIPLKGSILRALADNDEKKKNKVALILKKTKDQIDKIAS